MLTERTENKQPPLSDADAAKPLGVPVRLVVEELRKLARLGFAVRVNEESEAEHYVLAAAPDKITVGELIIAWEGLRGEAQTDGIAERYPALAAVKERLNASCLEGSTQTLRDVWLSMPEETGEEQE